MLITDRLGDIFFFLYFYCCCCSLGDFFFFNQYFSNFLSSWQFCSLWKSWGKSTLGLLLKVPCTFSLLICIHCKHLVNLHKFSLWFKSHRWMNWKGWGKIMCLVFSLGEMVLQLLIFRMEWYSRQHIASQILLIVCLCNYSKHI
jgi:hypothetical protein